MLFHTKLNTAQYYNQVLADVGEDLQTVIIQIHCLELTSVIVVYENAPWFYLDDNLIAKAKIH